MLGRTDSRLRLIALMCVFGVFAGALMLRLAYWQVGQADDLQGKADEQLFTADAEEQIRRGEITDSNGTVLATTAYRDRLAAFPDVLNEEERPIVAQRLAAILGMSAEDETALVATFQSAAPYVIVSRRLTQEQSDRVRAGLVSRELAALALEPQPVRFYPNDGGSPGTTLASQLLGFVTDDGQGRYGIEQFGQDLLAGVDGATAAIDLGADALPLPKPGGDITLTIDASLQLRLEKELYAAWVADRAPRVTGLVLDPYTGAVLAWASVPGYNANDYAGAADSSPDLFADPILSQVYEPGSVMKMLTSAAALERGVVTLDTPVADAKTLRLGDVIVRNGDHGSIGVVPFEDIIARSRNVGTGHVALSLADTIDAGAQILYDMWERLGIGRPTGIELGNESAGIVADPVLQPWAALDLVNRSFGQGVAITPLQLATAFCAMTNGGRLPVPHIIASLDGEAAEAPESQQVMETGLSETLQKLMVHVVEAGPHYAEETLIPNYVVGGKTGTAQIWDQRAGDWMPDTYNHTFVGFVGGDRPEAVILVRIHDTEPRVRRSWGTTLEITSNELFRRVALDAIDVLEIQPVGSGTEDGSAADPATSSPAGI
ncbi:MAG: penicillin-binding protein 2 [Candidatus Limnocylindrales bacterium]